MSVSSVPQVTATTPQGFPFRRVLSLEPLIEHWRERARVGSALEAEHAALILRGVEEAPELGRPIVDTGVIERHRPLIEEMIAAFFPRGRADDARGGAFAPYLFEPVYVTPAFRRDGLIEAFREWERRPEIVLGKPITAYNYVLERFYGLRPGFDLTLSLNTRDADTGLDRFFNLVLDRRFTRIELRGELPRLSDSDLERLVSDCLDLDLWRALLPPDRFEYHGLMLLEATEVTEQEALVALTRELLRNDAMASAERLDQLQGWVRTLLREPALQLGLICLHHDEIERIADAHPMGRSLLMSEGAAPECPFKENSFYGQVLRERRVVTVRDLAHGGVPSAFEQHLLDLRFRNLLIAPLQLEGRMVGLLELASPNPGDVHILSTRKLEKVLGLFATAMKRALDDEETRIQAVIKQQYTAIHPAVEWRFRQAARRHIHRADGRSPHAEEIVFPNVYSLYGLSDIRGSSSERGLAIQSDLLEQLEAARAIMVAANRANPLPALSELDFRIARFAEQVRDHLNTGDEVRVHEFLKGEAEAVLDQVRGFAPEVAALVDAYRARLDPQLGVLYERRKAYEESVTLINAALATFLDEQEAHAQRMFPHYFEKYKTDGVDYNIYVGASLQEDGRFDPLYLRNLRLWQLMLMCAAVWRLRELEPTLPVPLGVAHLILAQDAPISIRFRADEKRFDVDGAYNVRYEIIKKRIDKARVKNTREALTQPGHIAIVYTQPKQALEYRQYIDYLQAAGYLERDVEELELEDLQGVRGLVALRVTVAARRPARSDDLSERAAELVAAS